MRSRSGGEVAVEAGFEEAALLRAWGYALEPIGQLKAAPGYPSFEDIEGALFFLAEQYPAITRLESLGTSVEGRDLWALLITDFPDIEEDEPEFKYVSTMHGDEPLGTVLCLRLAERLLSGYNGEERIRWLVDETAIWIVPLMNPDGYAGGMRMNANGRDLNRDFPIWPREFSGFAYEGAPLREAGREPETQAVMRWTAAESFVLSANLHTGALLVNYPYDDDGGPSGVEQPTPDDALFRELALTYSRQNPPMYESPLYEEGIVNGAEWYVVKGGMMDWHYRYVGCCEVTIELSNFYAPPPERWDLYWQYNEESMLQYIEAVHWGVRGLVTDAETGEPLYAQVRVADRPQPVFTDPDVGDYHRLLLPGGNTLIISAEGYTPRYFAVRVHAGETVRVDAALTKAPPGGAICPAEAALKQHPQALASLRRFRDETIAPAPGGPSLIRGYYAAAPWATPLVQGVRRVVGLD